MIGHGAERSAIAFQLLAALEAYHQDAAPLLRGSGYDPELYFRLGEQFDGMRLIAASLPQLSVAWVRLLISRAELTHALFLAQRDRSRPAGLHGAGEAHRLALEELKDCCRRLLKAT